MDKYEFKVWEWGQKKKINYEILLKSLIYSRLISSERFIGAFIRENVNQILNLYDFQPYSVWVKKSKSFINILPKENEKITNEVIELPVVLNQKKVSLLIFIKKRLPINRIYLSNLPILKDNGRLKNIESMPLLFDLIQNVGNKEFGKWKKLKRDFLISNSQLFASLLLRYVASRDRPLIDDFQKVYKMPSLTADELSVFFEEWCVNGHLLHPTPKSKKGLSLEDIEKYSPESQSEYTMVSALLRKQASHFISSVNQSYEEMFNYLSPSFRKKVDIITKKRGLNPEDFYFILIHPWNYENYLRNLIAKELDSNDFILLNGLKVEANPLVAFRTVYIKDLNAYFKLPLNVQITSVVRTLSIKPCYNGVILSSLLAKLKKMNLLPSSFEVQQELASIRIKKDYTFYKNLSMVVREKNDKYVAPGDLLVPAVAFFEDSLINPSKKIIDDILKYFVKNKNCKNSVLEFYRSYIKLVVPPCITLLTKYGIGIEAHLQNSLIVFRNFRPHKFIYKDFDAISISLKRLRRHSQLSKFTFYPRSWNMAMKANFAQDKLMHSLIHSHVSELINHIDLNYGIDSDILWSMLSNMINVQLNSLANDKHFSEQAKEDLNFFFSDTTNIKSLLKMKLRRESKRYAYTIAENPLAAIKHNTL